MPLAAQLSLTDRLLPTSRFPRLCTSLLNRACDLCAEWRLGIRTTRGAASPHPDAHRYGYLAYHTSFKILRHLGLTPADVVADLGSGKGRVSCIAALHRIRESVGVEIDPPLHAQAEANGARLRGRRAPLRFVCGSAVDFDYDPVTVVVMFHPFGAETMHAVLARLEESLHRRPRLLRIVYCNPVLDPLLAAKPWLQLAERWTPGPWSRVKFPVHFYHHLP